MNGRRKNLTHKQNDWRKPTTQADTSMLAFSSQRLARLNFVPPPKKAWLTNQHYLSCEASAGTCWYSYWFVSNFERLVKIVPDALKRLPVLSGGTSRCVPTLTRCSSLGRFLGFENGNPQSSRWETVVNNDWQTNASHPTTMNLKGMSLEHFLRFWERWIIFDKPMFWTWRQ